MHAKILRYVQGQKKIEENGNFNEYLLMGWSKTHISLKQRYMGFTPPYEEIFIEISIFADFFLTVYSIIRKQ